MIAAVVGGYAIGSLPLGYLAGRRWGGVDLRAVGSHNVGATNMYRVSGPRLGLLVMAIDLVKGAAAVALAGAWWTMTPHDPVVAGVAAVAGHVYPVWLRGRGGKGVATACGAFVVLAPLATAVAAVVFVAAVWTTRLVSVGSLAASVTLPSIAAATGATPAVVWGGVVTTALIVWRHRGNVLRIWRGTERRLAVRETPRA